MQIYYLVMLMVGAIFSWGSIALYILSQKGWLHSPVGQLFTVLAFAVGMFYTWYTILYFWPRMPGRAPVRLVLFSITTFAIVWRFIILAKLLNTARRDNAIVAQKSIADS